MSSSLVPFLEDAVIYGSALSLSELLPGTQAVTSPVLGQPRFSWAPGKAPSSFISLEEAFRGILFLLPVSPRTMVEVSGSFFFLFFFLAYISASEIPLSINGWSRRCSPPSYFKS